MFYLCCFWRSYQFICCRGTAETGDSSINQGELDGFYNSVKYMLGRGEKSLSIPTLTKGMQRAWMDEWLINFARNVLDSRKCVSALQCLHGSYSVRYEWWLINVHLGVSFWKIQLLVRLTSILCLMCHIFNKVH